MKIRAVILGFVLISSFGIAQTTSSSCNISDTIASFYKKDADRLAIRRAYSSNSTWKDSINYNRTWSTNYQKALIAVHNATTLAARDTVIKIIKIHTLADPNIKAFYISADSNLTWMKNIRNNVFPTGNQILDNSITKFYFQKTEYDAWSNVPYHDVVYRSDTSFNVLPLTNKLFSLPGVVAAGAHGIALDGNDIFDSINVNFTMLTYTFGWQDCYSGCMKRRYWHFKIYNDCSVEYAGSHGNPVPLDVGIVESTDQIGEVKIFPNPANNRQTIDISVKEICEIVVDLIDINGRKLQTVYTGKSNLSPTVIIHDISSLPNSVYIYNISIQGQTIKKKFVKY